MKFYKHNIRFNTYTYSPEQNKAEIYINNKWIKITGFKPSEDKYENMLKQLRKWFKTTKSGYVTVTLVHTGVTCTLPDDKLCYSLESRNTFLRFIQGRHKGIGRFLNDDLKTYTEKEYGYKLSNVKIHI